MIGGDPRVRVDTNDPDRELDVSDHIINFPERITITGDVAVEREVLFELPCDRDSSCPRGPSVPELPRECLA